MTETPSAPKTESKSIDELFSLTDLLVVRMSYEQATIEMHECLVDKCRQSKDPVVRALDLSRMEPFQEALAEHMHILAQALDVLGDRPEAVRREAHEPFLLMVQAAQAQVCDPASPVLASMQALLLVQQYNEVAWGLLLALMKDAELQRFVDHFEQACIRHHEHRTLVQQSYEDVALGLVRRNRMVMRSARPLQSSMTGRKGPLFGAPRRV